MERYEARTTRSGGAEILQIHLDFRSVVLILRITEFFCAAFNKTCHAETKNYDRAKLSNEYNILR